MKVYNPSVNVYEAAKERVRQAIRRFPDFYVSFSGGKDSGVLVGVVLEVAKEEGKLPVKVVFSDLEAIFGETERYAKGVMEQDGVEPYWLCLEETDDNASSVYERYFRIWDKTANDRWVRPLPDMPYVINDSNCPPLLAGRINGRRVEDWTVTVFGEYLCDAYGHSSICNFIGMRSSESYGRHMAVATAKNREKLNPYTYNTKGGSSPRTWTCLPLYDWETADVWTWYAMTGADYNRVYDQMMRIGVPLSMQRTCSAFGEEQKKSLWMWPVMEPDTWERLLKRVEGVNFGRMYNHTNLSRNKVVKPAGVTWKQYCGMLMAALPEDARANFEEKFAIVRRYHDREYGVKMGLDRSVYECDSRKEARQKVKSTGLPLKVFWSYETLCGAIIKRDFVFKKYGFAYSKKMSDRVEQIQSRWSQGL